MTREEVLAMESGRDLDKLIAEKIFGREFESFPMGDCFYDGNGWVMADRYSTDISAVWEVVEKFPLSMIERVEVFVGNITVNVTLYPSTESEKSYTASSNSFGLSTCRAALLAVLGL